MRNIYHKGRNALMALAMAAGIAAIPAAPSFAADWQANDDDALLFDVRVGQYRVGDGVRGYQTDKGICVDFADVIIAFDLPVRLDKKSRRATGWLFEESRSISIDREANTVQIVNNNQLLSAQDVRDVPEGWCVDTQTLARWLNVDVVADQSNALLVIKADRKLPFELAEERKARSAKIRPATQFDLSKLPQAKDPYQFWRTPSIDVVTSLGVSRDKRNGNKLDARYEVFASGEIGGASFDARLSSNNRGVPESLRLRGYRTDPNGGLLGPLNATHFALGDVSTSSTPLGVQTTAGRGGFVTNRPLGRAESFDRTTFRGELPDGWEAELYRNEQLIGYSQSRGDGRYEFLDVALLYGSNRFEVVLYGPQGQIRRDVRMIPVGLDSIPPRDTYYWAAVQDAGRDLINFGDADSSDFVGLRGGFGLERGIDTRTSIAGSWFTAMLRGRRHNYLEGSIRRVIGPTLVEMAASSNLSGGYAFRAKLLAQVGQTLISGESVRLMGGYKTERYDLNLRSLNSFSIDHSFKIGPQYIPLRAEIRRSTRTDGSTRIEATSRLSFNIRQLNASAELQWEKESHRNGVNPPSRLMAAARLSGRVGAVRLRGEAQFDLTGKSGFRESQVTAEWRAGERSDWRTQLGYSVADKRGRLVIGHTKRFKHFALSGQIEAANDGSVAAGVSLAFSLGPDPRGGGIRVASEKLASSGQALAIVYQDENADGIRQSDEPLEQSVELTAGLSARGDPTDAEGRTIIDGLQPFEPVLIGIDASSLPDPFIQPATSGVVVTPRPGVPVTIELPLVAAGEISGNLQREGGKILSGVDLELLNKSGLVVKTTRSEYDGFFLFEFVPYGSYKLRVAALSASVIGVQAELSTLVELGRSKPVADLGIVSAKPVDRLAIAAQPQGP